MEDAANVMIPCISFAIERRNLTQTLENNVRPEIIVAEKSKGNTVTSFGNPPLISDDHSALIVGILVTVTSNIESARDGVELIPVTQLFVDESWPNLKQWECSERIQKRGNDEV